MRPDLTILLDAPVATLWRAPARAMPGRCEDRFEREKSEFFERVRSAYLARAAADPDRIAIVDATRSVDEIGAQILEQLRGESMDFLSADSAAVAEGCAAAPALRPCIRAACRIRCCC